MYVVYIRQPEKGASVVLSDSPGSLIAFGATQVRTCLCPCIRPPSVGARSLAGYGVWSLALVRFVGPGVRAVFLRLLRLSPFSSSPLSPLRLRNPLPLPPGGSVSAPRASSLMMMISERGVSGV